MGQQTDPLPTLWRSPLALCLSAARIRQLSRDSPIECRVRNLVLLFEAERCPLQRVKNVTKVKLCHTGYGIAFLTHVCELVGLG